MIIGITGGIGAGKSVVSRILRAKGYDVYDCDTRARDLMESNRDIIIALIEKFGSSVVKDDGTLDRPLIASRVFGCDETRLWLNSLVHGAVRDDITNWHSGKESEICFVESAILATSGLDRMCRRIWLVDAPEDLRRKRALDRGGVTPANLDQRIEAQKEEFEALPPEKTDIIENTDNQPLLLQVEELLQSIN